MHVKFIRFTAKTRYLKSVTTPIIFKQKKPSLRRVIEDEKIKPDYRHLTGS